MKMNTLCRTLEQHLPRHEMFVKDDSTDFTLCTEQILENTFRKQFGPSNDLLLNLLSDSEHAASLLLGSPLDKISTWTSTLAIVRSISTSIDYYIEMTAALGAVITNGHISKGPPLAKKVLEHLRCGEAKKADKGSKSPKPLPSHLLSLLTRLAEGDRSGLPPIPKKAKLEHASEVTSSKSASSKVAESSAMLGTKGGPCVVKTEVLQSLLAGGVDEDVCL